MADLRVEASNGVYVPPPPSAAEFDSIVARQQVAPGAPDKPDVQAGADDTAPKLDEYAQIEEPGKQTADTIRYQKKGDDHWTVVSKATSPQLYEQVTGDQKKFAALEKSKSEGYVVAGKDDKPPAFGDYSSVEKPTGWKDGAYVYETDGVIHYEVKQSDGSTKKYVVAQATNPGLYAQVKHDGELKELINVYTTGERPFRLAGPDEKAPAFDDVVPATWIKDDENGIITFDTRQGDRVVVVQDINPGLYDTIKDMFAVHDGLRAGGDGYQRPGPNDVTLDIAQVGPPGEFGDGTIRFSTKDGRKFIVNKFSDPVLYQQAVDNFESSHWGEVNDLLKKYGWSSVDDLDIFKLSTGEKDDKGNPLTVNDYAITKLLEDYRKGVENGTYAKDSDQAQLVRVMEAKAAYAAGRDITPYVEAVWGDGKTFRQFGDPAHLTPADLHAIIDGNKLDERMSELLQKDSIKTDFDAKFKEALGKISDTDKKNIKDKIVGMLEGDQFPGFLEELEKSGGSDLGEIGMKHMGSALTNRLLSSLALLDPDQATKTSQKLMLNSLTYQLNNLDPSKISDENKDLALKDTLSLLMNFIKTGSNVLRTSIGSTEGFLAEVLGDKTKLTEMRKIIEEALGNGFSTTGDEALNRINTAIGKYAANDTSPKWRQFFSTMASSGFLGTLAGGISLFSGIYQIVGHGGKLGDTWQQRLATMNSFVSFLSMGSHFVKLGDKILSTVGKTGLSDFMGLSATMPEVWGKDGLFKLNINSPFSSSLRTEVGNQVSTIVNEVELPRWDVDQHAYDGVADLFNEEAAASGVKVDRSVASKIASSVLKVTGALTDLAGGVADIVLGAFTIKSGIEGNDGLTKTAGALQVISGTFGAAAGAIETAALFGSVGILGTLTGPLFLVGAVIGIIGGIITVFIDHNKKQAATDKEGQWFKDLAADGLLRSDWGDKVEYARYEIFTYGSRDAPDDQSIYDYQDSEWDYFRTTPGKDGSSINRLDNTKHHDYNGDKKGMPDEPQEPPVTFGGGP